MCVRDDCSLEKNLRSLSYVVSLGVSLPKANSSDVRAENDGKDGEERKRIDKQIREKDS